MPQIPPNSVNRKKGSNKKARGQKKAPRDSLFPICVRARVRAPTGLENSHIEDVSRVYRSPVFTGAMRTTTVVRGDQSHSSGIMLADVHNCWGEPQE